MSDSTKLFCFRFDVDTHRCVQQGVPNLLALARDAGVPFTFFVNMGRAVSRAGTIRELLSSRSATTQPAQKLSPVYKLGVKETLVSAVVNPYVGSANLNVIERAHQEGHEVGLHGGTNHARWQRRGRTWSGETLHHELEWGLRVLEAAGVPAPAGFASPGWQGSARLNTVLETLNFEYVADTCGAGYHQVSVAQGTTCLADVPTNIVGQPAGVAYIENARARGFDDHNILDDFRAQLRRQPAVAIVYEHPYYAGIRELDLIVRMLDVVISEGFTPVRMCDIAQTLCNSPATDK